MMPSPVNFGRPQELLPRWGRINVPDPAVRENRSQVVEAWGVPMRCLSCTVSTRPAPDGGSMSTTTGVMWLRASDAPGARGFYLPWRPIWTGIVVNTALYALACMVVYAVVRDIIIRTRRRRAEVTPTVAATEARA
jgi:hypothetical protein